MTRHIPYDMSVSLPSPDRRAEPHGICRVATTTEIEGMQTTVLDGVYAMDVGTPWSLFDTLSEVQITLTQNMVLAYFPGRVRTRIGMMELEPKAPWLTRDFAERLQAVGVPVRGFARVAILRTTGLPR